MSGLLSEIAGGDTPARLAVHAEWFLRGGGTVSLGDWSKLGKEERAALIAAGNRMRVQRAEQIAMAMDGPAGIAFLRAEVDGGEAVDAQLLADVVRSAADRVNRAGL